MSRRRKARPGLMIYHEWVPALERLTDEQRGKLLYGALRYSLDGTEPQLCEDPVLEALWPLVQCRADADAQKYDSKCEDNSLRRRYAIYVQQQERNGREALEWGEWRARIATDDNGR